MSEAESVYAKKSFSSSNLTSSLKLLLDDTDMKSNGKNSQADGQNDADKSQELNAENCPANIAATTPALPSKLQPSPLNLTTPSILGGGVSTDNNSVGLEIDPKFLFQLTYRSSLDTTGGLADQLKAAGEECKPLCSPRRLNRRRQKRALKRIPILHDDAALNPPKFFLHPPCIVHHVVYDHLEEEYLLNFEKKLRHLYNEQLSREVNIERFRRGKRSVSSSYGFTNSAKRGAVTGRFSNSYSEVDD